jgi:hypothetical protein
MNKYVANRAAFRSSNRCSNSLENHSLQIGQNVMSGERPPEAAAAKMTLVPSGKVKSRAHRHESA